MNNNDDNYKFVGIMNRFGVQPDFVYPIFENDGKFYFSKSSNGIISFFREIKDINYIKKIHFLNSFEFNYLYDYYDVGDEQIVAFQISEKDFFISDFNSFIPFIQNFKTDDYILAEEIDVFLDIVKRKKNKVKIKAKTL